MTDKQQPFKMPEPVAWRYMHEGKPIGIHPRTIDRYYRFEGKFIDGEPLFTADQVRAAYEHGRDESAKKIAAQALLIKSLEEQRSTLRKLEAEGREARETLGSERAANAILTAEIEALRSPADQGEKDTERLDWLEKHDGRLYNMDRIACIVGTGFLVANVPNLRGKSLREVIDAAIDSTKGSTMGEMEGKNG